MLLNLSFIGLIGVKHFILQLNEDCDMSYLLIFCSVSSHILRFARPYIHYFLIPIPFVRIGATGAKMPLPEPIWARIMSILNFITFNISLSIYSGRLLSRKKKKELSLYAPLSKRLPYLQLIVNNYTELSEFFPS